MSDELKTKKVNLPCYKVQGRYVVSNIDVANAFGVSVGKLNKKIKRLIKEANQNQPMSDSFVIPGKPTDNGANTFFLTREGCLMLGAACSDGFMKKNFNALVEGFNSLELANWKDSKKAKVTRTTTELEKFFIHRLSKVEDFTEFFNAVCDVLFDLKGDQYRDLIYAVRNYSKDYDDMAILNLANLIQTEKVLWQLGNDAKPKDIKKKIALSA